MRINPIIQISSNKNFHLQCYFIYNKVININSFFIEYVLRHSKNYVELNVKKACHLTITGFIQNCFLGVRPSYSPKLRNFSHKGDEFFYNNSLGTSYYLPPLTFAVLNRHKKTRRKRVFWFYNTKKYPVSPCSLVGAPAPAPVLLPHATKFFDIPAISFIE